MQVSRWWASVIFSLALACLSTAALAREAAPASADPVLEDRVMRVASELRCLVCQNETIAASNADLAVDLRNQVRTMLRNGQSEREVFDFMTERYGDFVLYRPPLNNTTVALWFGPFIFLGGGLVGLWWMLRRRSQLPAEEFEADENALGDEEPGMPPRR